MRRVIDALCLCAGLIGSALRAEEALPQERLPADAAMPSAEAQALVLAIQKRYETVGNFEAKFIQRSFHPKLKMEIEDGGSVRMQKPSRMRWDYTLRREYSVIGQGDKVWIVEPGKKKATVYPFQAQLALTFLTGLGELSREFDFEMAAERPPGFENMDCRTLALTPKQPNPYLKSIRLVVAPDGSEVLGTVVTDPYGKPTTTVFTDRVHNGRVDPAQFDYRPPEAYEVLDPQKALENNP